MPQPGPLSLRWRLVLSSVLVAVMTMAGIGVLLRVLLWDHLQQDQDARLQAFLQELAGALEPAAGTQGGLKPPRRPLSDPRFRKPFSGLYWQVSTIVEPPTTPPAPDASPDTAPDTAPGTSLGADPETNPEAHSKAHPGTNPGAGRPLLRSRSLWDDALPFPPDSLADGTLHRHSLIGPRGAPLRVLERRLTFPNLARPVRLIIAADQSRQRALLSRFTWLLLTALGGLVLGLSVALWLQVSLGLRPLRRLRAALARLHDGSASGIEGQYPPELAPVVSDLNALLAAYRGLLERARAQAGSLAHSLKTPLAILANEGNAGPAPAPRPELAQQITQMRALIDYHLARARASSGAGVPGAVCPVAHGLAAISSALARLHAPDPVPIHLDGVSPELRVAMDTQDFNEIFGNLLDNACKWAARRIQVTATPLPDAPGRIRISVDDDGPGLTGEEMAQARRWGLRLDEGKAGSGLGLAIVDDLVRLYGGEMTLARSALGGLAVSVTLPIPLALTPPT